MKNRIYYAIAAVLAFALCYDVAKAQQVGYPTNPTFTRCGLGINPLSATVTTFLGGALGPSNCIFWGQTDGSGATIYFVPNETGIDPTTRFFGIGPGANGGNGELALFAPWGNPIELFSDAGGASGIVALADSASVMEMRGTRNYVNSNTPIFDIVELDAILNEKVTRITATSGLFSITSMTDALGAGSTLLVANRVGATYDSVVLSSTGTITLNSAATNIGAGTAAAPGLAFLVDADTGFYRPAANQLSMSIGGTQTSLHSTVDHTFYAGGTQILNIAAGQTQLNNPLQFNGDGSASAPAVSWFSDTNMGLYRVGADQLGVTLGGTLRNTFFAGQMTSPDGSASAPTYAFNNDPDGGMYRYGNNEVGFAAGGTARLRLSTIIDTLDTSIDDSVDDNVNVAADMSVVGDLNVTGTITGTFTGQGAVYGCYVDSAATAERCPSGWSVSLAGTVYTVTHNLGLSNANDLAISCTLIVNPADDRFCQIDGTGTNSFTIEPEDVGAGVVTNDFMFTAYRVN